MTGILAILARLAFGGLKLIRAGWDWLTENPVRVLIAVLVVVAVVQHFTIRAQLGTISDRTAERDDARAQAKAEKAAHKKTVENYASARVEAERLQGLRNQRVAREQAANNERASHGFEVRLADARARYDRLRQAVGETGGSGPGRLVLPASSEGAAPAAQASGDLGLPGGGTCAVEMSLHERFVATAQAIQLDALIDWAESQGAVDVNADPAAQ